MIQVRNLTKVFKLYRKPSDRLLEALVRRPRHQVHAALSDVSFAVEPGETLGILGRNGAGKSTLLKLLMGVLLPDRGEIRMECKVTGLLELGTGFESMLTGLQNIERNGLLLGMTRPEINRRRDAIVAFAELGDYIREPLRTYSSGMRMRLAFAVAIHADPSCFLIDEALSVGDAHFQQKCVRRIQAFRKAGGSLVFVSHDLHAMKVLCDRALVLDEGRIVASGTPESAVNHYNRIIARLDEEPSAKDSGGKARRMNEPRTIAGYGTLALAIVEAEIKGKDSGTDLISAGEDALIRLRVQARDSISEFTLGILVRDRYGQDIFGTNTHFLDHPLALEGGASVLVEFRFPMNLGPGKYTLTAAVHSEHDHLKDCYHWCDSILPFEVAGVRGAMFSGIARLEPRVQSLTTA